MTTVLTGVVTRGEATWIVNLQDLPEGMVGTALGRTWKEARALARETAGQLLNLTPDEVVVDLVLADRELQELIDEAKKKKAAAQRAHFELDSALGRAARTLTRNASVRDVGEMLGYSAQYVAKLAPRRNRSDG